MLFTLEIKDGEDKVQAFSKGEGEVYLVYEAEYHPGDRICLSLDEYPAHIRLQFDDALGSSLNYITGPVEFQIPFDEKKTSYSPKTFLGTRHLLFAKESEHFEWAGYRNLALNVNDSHGSDNLFPHAKANVETRGEAVFAARNAIDGVCVNYSHGEWPFESWGINRRDDATVTVSFGRMAVVDRIRLYTRADFPHDNWWEQVSFTFSDGERMTVKLQKSTGPHEILFEAKETESVMMSELIKADDPSPFPALTQIEVYGRFKQI